MRTYGDALAAVVVVRPGEEAGLRRSLDAVAAATGRPVHVVVADSRADGPPLDANGAEVLRLGEDVRAAAAVNRAVAALDADVGWVAAGWAGAVWGAGAIDALLAAAARRPRAGLLGPAAPDPTPDPVAPAQRARRRRAGPSSPRNGHGDTLAALLRPGDPWPPSSGDPDSRDGRPRLARRETPTRAPGDPDSRGVGEGAVLLRRAAFDSVDGFDPRLPALAVLDLARRLDRAGWLVVPVPDALVDGRVQGPPGRHAEVRRYLAERNRGVLRAPLRAALRVTAAPG